MGKYKLSFDIWAILLVLTVMLPNFIWFAVPAPHDILRENSVTETIDTIASVCQALFIAALCLVVNQDRRVLRLTPLICGCIGLYYAGWVLYYLGYTSPPVILLLTVPPCLSFLLFAIGRKNLIAVPPVVVFTVCHLIYSVVNFIIY